MPFDPSNVDLLLQYILLMAGEEDDYTDRQLGPIHLIKYVYLADLSYARRHGGNTFTEVRWQFYKFGPWSQAVNERIEPALVAIGAEKKAFPSSYDDKDDWVRWFMRDDQLAEARERKIPAVITMCLKREIHKFGKDTAGLLDYVYTTKPMLAAAPNEYLDFTIVVEDQSDKLFNPQQLRTEKLSTKKRKSLKDRMLELQQKQRTRDTSKPRLINPVKNPRYDAIFNDGIAWLDNLAGEQILPGEVVAEFSPEVWKSSTRKGGDVS